MDTKMHAVDGVRQGDETQVRLWRANRVRVEVLYVSKLACAARKWMVRVMIEAFE
jgi:hypothetical protein